MGGSLELTILKRSFYIGLTYKWGGSPFANSIANIPADHTSTLFPYYFKSFALTTSGANQQGVPFLLALVFYCCVSMTAYPKSANLISPLFLHRMLSDLISLWMMFYECKAFSECMTLYIVYLQKFSEQFPSNLSQISVKLPPSMSSRMIQILFEQSKASIHRTTASQSFLLLKYCMMPISFIMLAFSSADFGQTYFRAKIAPSSIRSHLYTIPQPPSPSWYKTLQCFEGLSVLRLEAF